MAKTLSEHAAYELTKSGLANNEDPEARQTAINVMALVRRVEKQKNSEAQVEFILESLNRLLNGLPLTAITDDPEEWEKFELERKNLSTGVVDKQSVWQSTRATHIVSYDEGKTWIDQATGKSGTSTDHVQEAARKEEEANHQAQRKAPANKVKNPIGHVNPDVPASEQGIDDPRNNNKTTGPVAKSNDNVNKKSEK